MFRSFVTGFALMLTACGCASQHTADSNDPNLIENLQPTQQVSVTRGTVQEISFTKLAAVDSARLWVGDAFTVLLDTAQNSYRFDTRQIRTLGAVTIRLTAYAHDRQQTLQSSFTVTAAQNAPRIKPRIVATMPHLATSYTQGLLIHDGTFYESTGQYGESRLLAITPQTGQVIKSIDLPRQFFGEGLALLGGKLYQLTWLEGKCLVYDLNTFKLEKEFTYQGEGWGLTTDGSRLYMSNGSSQITVRDPETFRAVRTFEVFDGARAVDQINELEWIDGKIWANVYTSNAILIIDPENGEVETVIDCSELAKRIGNAATADVLNGIALDPSSGRIFVTGKLWDTVFEIKL